MPVRKINTRNVPQHRQLVSRLSAEWTRAGGGSAAEPVILEEENGRGDVVHVYVVWSDWAQLPRERRGEVIMDAAEQVKSLEDVLKITIAMGLTPDEADRFRLQWKN